MSPFNAWVLLKGLETLGLRVDQHIRNATALAGFLSEQPQVSRVIYPGLESHPQHELAMKQMSGRGGGLIAIELAGGKSAAFSLLDNLQLIDISNNLGDAKSLATHPWTTTHQRVPAEDKITMGITEGMLRLSVGLEDIDDLKEDLSAALRV
jgi:O-succinylhomoserine sulfhydrylase